MPTRQGTTLYLCLEDSMLRIQNRLFEITEDAPPNVHFCTEIITLWVTPRVKAAIQARAKQADMTVTDYLCLYGLGKKILQVDGLGQVLTELKAQGRNLKLVTGWNCTAQSVWTEIRPTKEQSRKMDGRQYYHFVQSHVDTEHLHNHLVVNSASFRDGRKLHQSAADLQAHRLANDEICAAHGLELLPPPQKLVRQKRRRFSPPRLPKLSLPHPPPALLLIPPGLLALWAGWYGLSTLWSVLRTVGQWLTAP